MSTELDELARRYRVWGRWPAAYAAQDWVTFLGRPNQIRTRAVAALGVGPGATVLEVGCGTGRNFAALEEAIGPTGQLIGLDYSAAMLAAARRLVTRHEWRNVTLVQADVARLPVRHNSVEAVLAVLVMSAAPDHVTALRQCHGVLRPGAALVVCDARPFPRSPMRLANPVVRLVYRALAGWHPDRDVMSELEQLAGEVSMGTCNLGGLTIATVRRT